MTTPNLARARRALDDDLDAFARAIIDRDPQKLLQQAQLLIDQAAHLIALQYGHMPPSAQHALASANRAAAAYHFPATIREIQYALDVTQRPKA
ncbi:MAG: hypothetical protein KDI55_20285 [Anaerolineae bacterium]|nr:hypothetical protein [Anaerolineae bacterium]